MKDKAPLRLVVDSRLSTEFPLTVVDVLECGHEFRQRTDTLMRYGALPAKRRRCKVCVNRY
jgi:hypothetical protein